MSLIKKSEIVLLFELRLDEAEDEKTFLEIIVTISGILVALLFPIFLDIKSFNFSYINLIIINLGNLLFYILLFTASGYLAARMHTIMEYRKSIKLLDNKPENSSFNDYKSVMPFKNFSQMEWEEIKRLIVKAGKKGKIRRFIVIGIFMNALLCLFWIILLIFIGSIINQSLLSFP